MIPIPKCKTPTIADLRPISLISFPAKVFEKVVFKQLKDVFNHNFGKHQFGFREKSSTECALIALHDHVTSFLDKKDCLGVQIVAYDYTKAFDKIRHDIIIDCFLKLHFPYSFVKWLCTYLSGRTQSVKIGNVLSDKNIITSGIPQGSVMGPAIFSIVIHCSTGLFKFADDITLSLPIFRNANYVITETNNVNTWSNEVSLTLNAKKSEFMYISVSRSSIPVPLNIPQVNRMKLLGVIFNKDLTWDDHILHVKKIFMSRYYAIKVLKL